MNERTTLEVIAPTVEEALMQGLAQLGLTAADVSVEVLDSGSKGLFGLGGRQVRVLLSVNPPPGSLKAKTAPASKPERKAAPAQKAESKPKASTPASATVEKRDSSRPAPKENKPAPTAAPVSLKPTVHDELIDKTEELISKLIHLMGMQAQISAHYAEDDRADRRSIEVDIRGNDLSSLVGKNAETLNSLQHVASLMVGKESGQWVQLTIDIEGFRARREKQLQQLANRMADQVIRTNRKATLEPMPSEDRRIIHIALRGHPAVSTESAGDEPHRKVVILPKK